MSAFHSTVSRRDFMKALGFGAAGLGTAAATAPVFHDLDELIASPAGEVTHPWWVTYREHYDPTVELDWDLLKKPFSADTSPYSFGYIGGYTKFRDTGIKPGITGNIPGRRHKEYALMYGSRVMRDSMSTVWPSLNGPEKGKTPEDMEVPKWSGSQEEAARMLRSAIHFFGAPKTGFLEFDDRVKTIGREDRMRYENVDKAYMDGSTYVLPTSATSVIVSVLRQPITQTQFQGGPEEDEIDHYPPMQCGSHIGYGFRNLIRARIQEFLRTLGYLGIGGVLYYNVGAGMLAGTSELGRLNHAITPEWGPMIRANLDIITDLPLPPTRPIDAGITRFCDDCGICADVCPTSSLYKEKERTWEVGGNAKWNRLGVKKWPHNYQTCKGCPFCDTHCVFTQKNFASIHSVVKGTLATTPIFNGFFATMSERFGYGHKNNYDEWWDRDLDKCQLDNIAGAATPPDC